jgi:hypothetical protein
MPRSLATLVLVAGFAAPASADVVTDWMHNSMDAIRGHGGGPGPVSRAYAMEAAAVYDAVVAIDRNYRPVHATANPPVGTSHEAAVVKAAHDVLVALMPDQAAMLDPRMTVALAGMPDGSSKTNGMALGADIAQQILAWRTGDGSDVEIPYDPPIGPGIWRPTAPNFDPPWGAGWGLVRPFVIPGTAPFMVPPPPALSSQRYTDAFNQVKSLGEMHSTTRTDDQTNIAYFWANDRNTTSKPMGQWNDIAMIISAQRHLTLAQNARLLALLNVGMADGGVVCWQIKYTYDLWRPITAIPLADTDGNPDTVADPDWRPLADALPAPNTPPFPAYTSGHATFGAVSAEILARYFGSDTIPFSCGTDEVTGMIRNFTSFSQASEENAISRIYLGVHWIFDATFGIASGTAVGDYVFEHGLQPRCAADFNNDGVTNIIDFLNYLSAYAAGDAGADINGDGVITVADFLAFLNVYSTGCP